MRSQPLRSKSLSLLATSALTLLLCSGSFDISKVHASDTAFSRDEVKTILELKKGTNKDYFGKPMSDNEAKQIVLDNRRSSNNTNSGGNMNSEEKAEYERKLEEAKRLQEEQLKKIEEQREQAERLQKEKAEAELEAAKKAEEHKKKLSEEQENRKILEDKLKQQMIEHDKVLKSIQETHSKNVDIEKKQVEKLQTELTLNLKSHVFQGKPFLEEKLEEVEKRLQFLETLGDQSDELKEFIGISLDSLKAFKQQADTLDPNGDPTDLLDFQKKVINFNYEFSVADLRFITQRANKSGMNLPDGWELLSKETQEKLTKAHETGVKEKVDEQKKKDDEEKAKVAALRISLPQKAQEAFDKYTKIINSKSYLKDDMNKTSGLPSPLTIGLNGLKQIVEFKDYATASLTVLKAKEIDISGKISGIEKRIEFLTNSQHPETATPEMIEAASALYMSADFPGTKSVAAIDKQTQKIKEGQDFRKLFSDRLKGDIVNVTYFLGLVNAREDVIQGYLDNVLKTDPKKKSFENLRKAFGEGFKEIYNGTLDPNKAYAYYLVVNAFVSLTPKLKRELEDFNLSWQKNPQSMLRSFKSIMRHLEEESVLPELKKAEEIASKQTQNIGGTATNNNAQTPIKNKGNIFDRFIHDEGLENSKLTDLWLKDNDLKKIAGDEKKVAQFAEAAKGGLPYLLNAILGFISDSYGEVKTQSLQKKLEEIDAGEKVTNPQLLENLKNTIKEVITGLTGGGVAGNKKSLIDSLPTETLKDNGYQEAVLIFSQLLDDDAHLKGLQVIKSKLESGSIQNNKLLDADLRVAVLAALQSITKNKPVIVEVTTTGSGEQKKPIFRFDFEGNTFTPKEFQSEFEAANNKLKDLSVKYDNLVSDYETGKTIFPPSLKLLAITEPSSAALLESFSRTSIMIDETFVAKFFDALKATSEGFKKNNKAYAKVVASMQSGFPAMVNRSEKSSPQEEAVAKQMLIKWVNDNFELVESLHINKVIVPERQSADVSYAYLKMMFAFQPLLSTQWVYDIKPTKTTAKKSGAK